MRSSRSACGSPRRRSRRHASWRCWRRPIRTRRLEQKGETMRSVTRLLVTAGLVLVFSGAALAQGGRTIRAIVPYPPGGSADVLMRILAQQVNETAGTNIVVENRPGAGTVIATEFVSRAPADGNTVLVMSNSFVINAHMR